jgi:hypothetical protein
VLAINEYTMITPKPFTCQDTIYGNLNGNVTGILYPDIVESGTSSIEGMDGEGIKYSANNLLIECNHLFTVNNNEILNINKVKELCATETS